MAWECLAEACAGASPLVEITGFGTNPGELRCSSFVPEHLQPRLRSSSCCTAAARPRPVMIGAGWSTLAEHYGFALLMPEQQRTNNAKGCFNWFNPDDTARDHGEACSIRQMIARMAADHGIDASHLRHRAFRRRRDDIGDARDLSGSVRRRRHDRRPALWRRQQCAGSPRRHDAVAVPPGGRIGRSRAKRVGAPGAVAKLSVWHGSADRTVNPAQCQRDRQAMARRARSADRADVGGDVDGYPHQVWWNTDGETIVESYTITDMAHGTPLGLADNDERYGAEGAFLIEAGISSSYHIAGFFGLTGRVSRPLSRSGGGFKRERDVAGRPADSAAPRNRRSLPRSSRSPRSAPTQAAEPPHRRGIDVSAVITRALTAAGLMK